MKDSFESSSFTVEVSDYEDAPFYHLLLQLPPELAKKHLQRIEREALDDTEAATYLQELIDNREETLTESNISDASFSRMVEGKEEALFKQLETWTRHNPDNYLGGGTTAKVKSYELLGEDGEILQELAIKYVVSPNEKTLTAQGEHDVIAEVERMKYIEAVESQHENRSRFLRVPHPYLHHSTPEVQLFGMEKIDGVNLYEVINDKMSDEFVESVKQSDLMRASTEGLVGIVERFFDTMHEYCLHGDIKPRNIMLDRSGVFYVIDFGQSRLAHTIPGEATEQFDNLKQEEIKLTQSFIKQALSKLRSYEQLSDQ